MPRAYHPTALSTVCGKPDRNTPSGKCGGVLYDVSSRLAMGMGVVTLKCDRCLKSWGVKVSDRPTSVPVH